MSQTTATTIDVKHLSSGPVFGLKGAIYLDPSGTFACIERAKAGTFAREFTETIQNDPHLKRFLSSLMVVLLNIEGNCSGLRAKPAHFSGHLPPAYAWDMKCTSYLSARLPVSCPFTRHTFQDTHAMRLLK